MTWIELLELMAMSIPVLTTVSEQHVDAWKAFTGGAPALRADASAVDSWPSGALAATTMT